MRFIIIVIIICYQPAVENINFISDCLFYISPKDSFIPMNAAINPRFSPLRLWE